MSRFVVTGAGMLGTALTERLRADGHDVVNIDVAARPGVTVADLRDIETLRAPLQGADGVFHTAALHGWRDNPPRDFFDVNVAGTWNLLEAMQGAGVRRLVHSSTVGVYGESEHRRIVIGPNTDTGAALDVYGVTKNLAEQVVRLLSARFSIDAAALRYGGFAQLIEGSQNGVLGSWAECGAVVDLEDVVEANVRAMQRLPLPRFGYVVIPSGGSDSSPYEVDASATEADLGFEFRHPFTSLQTRA